MDVASVGAGALVIYGIVGVVRDHVEQLKPYSFVFNFVLGLLFGYFNLFGVSGIEQGIIASLSSTGASAFVNKIKQ